MSQQQRTQSTGTESRTNLYTTAVSLPEETRIPTIQALNQVLADTTVLQSQAKFAHWNVKGQDFYQSHLLFDEIAETLADHVDVVAERVTALGGQATGTTRTAAEVSRIPEPPERAVSAMEHVEWLAEHVARHANFLREEDERVAGLGDEDTADLLTELSLEVDKQLYLLEAHLQTEVRDQIPVKTSQARGIQSGTPMRIGDQQGVSQSIAGPESGTSRIEIQDGAPQTMAPAQGSQPPGTPQDRSQPPGGPQNVPRDVAQPIDASGSSLQGGPHGFRQEQRSIPPQQQSPIQSRQQTQFQPQQQGPAQSQQQEPVQPQEQGLDRQQPPLSQPPKYQGAAQRGAQTFDAPGSGFQNFPRQPGP